MEEKVEVVIGARSDQVGPEAQAAAKAVLQMKESMEAALKQLGADFQVASNQMGQAMSQAADRIEQSMSRARKATEESTSQMTKLMREAYQQVMGFLAVNAIVGFLNDTKDAVMQAESSFRGLEAVANFTGVGIGRAFQEASRLASDGLITVADASKALQNLLQRGYTLEQSVAVLERLKDAAAFNRQATLSMTEAVVTATEGLKNENSVLVDNAGVIKNVSVMWEEYAKQIGTTRDKLTQAQKIQAEYNGIMKETEAQLGNAAKAANGLQGEAARSNKAFQDLKVTVGEALTPAFNLFYTSMQGVYTFFTRLTQGIQIVGAAFAAAAIDIANFWSASKNLEFDTLGAKLKANAEQFRQTVDEIINRPPGGTITPLADNGRRKQDDYTPSSGWKNNMQAYEAGLQNMLSTQKIYGDKAKQVEADYWQSILNSAKLSTEERMDLEKRVYSLRNSLASKSASAARKESKDATAATLADYRLQEEAAGRDLEVKLEVQNRMLAEVKRIYGQDSAEYARAAARKVQTERALQDQLTALRGVAIDAAREAQLQAVAFDEQYAQQAYQAKQISYSQLIQLQRDFEERRYQIELTAAQERQALVNPKEDPVRYAQLTAQIEAIHAGHIGRMKALDNELLGENNFFGQMVTNLETTWSAGLSRMMQGSLSFRNAWRGMLTTLKSAFFDTVAQMIVRWALGETMKTTATASATAVRLAIEAGAAIQSVAIWAAAALKNILISAYQAMAAAWAAISGIPYVGPFLAPVVAAATLAGVIAIGSNIASAEGGYNIPSGVNPMTQLHEEEMVLPADIANPLRQQLAGGGGMGGGGNVNIYAMDAKDVQRVFRKHGPALMKSLGGQVRNFNVSGGG